LTPVEPADPKRLAGLIADLDSAEFAAREKAARDLGRIGKPAAAALREAKEKSESAEVRRRAGELLDKLNGPTTPAPEELRAARAVEVLEWIGSAEARGVLTGLAKGDAAAPL